MHIEVQQQRMVQLNRSLLRIVIFLLILFAIDRAVAYIYFPDKNSKEITLYSTEWCSYCASVRQYFETHNMQYKELDVERSAAGMLGLWAFRADAVPVVVVGDQIIYGYDMEKVSAALDRLKPKLVSATE